MDGRAVWRGLVVALLAGGPSGCSAWSDNSEPSDYSLRSLADELRRIDESRWSVKLIDETVVSVKSVQEVIGLPNSNKHTVVSATFENGSYNNRIKCEFINKNFFSPSIRVSISGQFHLVQQLRSDLETLFTSYTPFWGVTKGVGGLIIPILFIFAVIFTVYEMNGDKTKIVFEYIPFFFLISILYFSLYPLIFSTLWNWVFPKCEF